MLDTFFHFLTSLVAVSSSFGMTFILLLRAELPYENKRFTALCVVLGVWGALSLFAISADLRSDTPEYFYIYAIISCFILTVSAYYYFILAVTRAGGTLKRMGPIVLVLAVISLGLLWSGRVFAMVAYPADVGLRSLPLRPEGYTLVALSILVVLLAFWAVMNSEARWTTQLRIPALLIVVACITNAFDFLVARPLDLLLFAIAVLWMGRVLFSLQLYEPLAELRGELNVANLDLKRALNDLARETKRVNALREDLLNANQHKSNFLATMSHELRTPLNSIVGYSELLQSGLYGDLSDKQLDRLEKINRNGNSLLVVIDEILDLSKIEAGKLDLDTGTVYMEAVFGQILAELERRCEEKGLVLQVDIQDDLPGIYGDTTRIRQIVENITSNAVKFTNEGHIAIKAHRVDVAEGVSKQFQLPLIGWLSDGTWVIIAVTDTGIGIAPEDQAKIFMEFSQVDGSRTREFEGIGLGLTITRKLVELHGGSIWLRSQPEAGSTFFVALPTPQTLKIVDSSYRDVLGGATNASTYTEGVNNNE